MQCAWPFLGAHPHVLSTDLLRYFEASHRLSKRRYKSRPLVFLFSGTVRIDQFEHRGAFDCTEHQNYEVIVYGFLRCFQKSI